MLDELGQVQRLSQTGLRRRLRRTVLKTLEKMSCGGAELGQDGPPSLTGLNT